MSKNWSSLFEFFGFSVTFHEIDGNLSISWKVSENAKNSKVGMTAVPKSKQLLTVRPASKTKTKSSLKNFKKLKNLTLNLINKFLMMIICRLFVLKETSCFMMRSIIRLVVVYRVYEKIRIKKWTRVAAWLDIYMYIQTWYVPYLLISFLFWKKLNWKAFLTKNSLYEKQNFELRTSLTQNTKQFFI